MTFTFSRVSAAAQKMRVEDVYIQKHRLWVRLHEKGGKLHQMPCKIGRPRHNEHGDQSAGVCREERSPAVDALGRHLFPYPRSLFTDEGLRESARLLSVFFARQTGT